MAGNYPDVPGPRMAYDRDGTEVLTANGTAMTIAQLQSLNDENIDASTVSITTGQYLVFVFPQPRDIVGIFGRTTVSSITKIEMSTNTTNGQDGTWTEVVADFSDGTPAYRNDIRAFTIVGARAVRFFPLTTGTWQPTSIHLYGTIPTASDRLSFWHPTLDAEIGGAYFDWGDVPRGASQTRDFRLRNRSTTKTAGSITVIDEALTDAGVPLPPQFTYSADGGTTFTETLTVPNLIAGATSAVYRLRLLKSTTASLGIWVVRHVAVAATWT